MRRAPLGRPLRRIDGRAAALVRGCYRCAPPPRHNRQLHGPKTIPSPLAWERAHVHPGVCERIPYGQPPCEDLAFWGPRLWSTACLKGVMLPKGKGTAQRISPRKILAGKPRADKNWLYHVRRGQGGGSLPRTRRPAGFGRVPDARRPLRGAALSGVVSAAFKRWSYFVPEISRAQNKPLLLSTVSAAGVSGPVDGRGQTLARVQDVRVQCADPARLFVRSHARYETRTLYVVCLILPGAAIENYETVPRRSDRPPRRSDSRQPSGQTPLPSPCRAPRWA